MLRLTLPNERLTIDYSTLEPGYRLIFNCSCGYNGCRGAIRAFHALPAVVQDRYLERDAVPGFIREAIPG